MAQGKKGTLKERLAKARESKVERAKIFKALCQHIKEGYSIDCFGLMTLPTIEEWLKLYPQEFVREDLDIAINEGKLMWEHIGKGQANGTCHGNAQAWKFNMTNRYRWIDKVNIDADIKGAVSVEVISYATQRASQASVSGVIT
jgi:hypothetical protein